MSNPLFELIQNNVTDPYPQIPGDLGLPWIGKTLDFLGDPIKTIDDTVAKHGPIFKWRIIGQNVVGVADAELAKEILQDKKEIYSARKGWDFVMGELFKNGLLLRDKPQKHRLHRDLLQLAFQKSPMVGYTDIMSPLVDEYFATKDLSTRKIHTFAEVKALTLQLAGEVFFGVKLDKNLQNINKAISDIVYATSGLLRYPIPFTVYGQGMLGRASLIRYFKGMIEERRHGDGKDLFSELCRTELNGTRLTDAEIIDHAIFILMAAHDTTASSITSLIYQLGKHQNWQDKLRTEAESFYTAGDYSYGRMNELEQLGYAFKEVLRLHPPLVVFPRKTVADVNLGGYHLKAGTRVAVVAHSIHRRADYWPNPDSFLPERFANIDPEDKKIPTRFIPFGYGKHLCLGLNFAQMQAKLVVSKLLMHYKWQLDPNYEAKFMVPLQEPSDGLPLKLEKVQSVARAASA